jgi:ribosomal protein S18 acetylase RimI-like enzyme
MQIYDDDYLKDLWQAHARLTDGVIYNKIDRQPKATFFWSDVPGEFYNFAVPNDAFSDDELTNLEREFAKTGNPPSIVLHAPLQAAGMAEKLIRKGYKSAGNECWVALDPAAYSEPDPTTLAQVIEVTPDTFDQFYEVLSKVFGDWPGNDNYLRICKRSLTGELSGTCPDLSSQFFIIQDDGKPVAGAALLSSKKADAAYLHNAGTLPEYRGRGYQTALVRYRAHLARQAKISKIYSAVEPGSQSWQNFIKAGFAQTPWFILMTKND